jgi:Flp pilus assembly pilin Flp
MTGNHEFSNWETPRMRKLFLKMWKDDAGIVAFEYLLVATIVGLGLVVGLSAVSVALNAELTELAQAILALDQTYSVASQSTCVSSKNGSSAQDTNGSVSYGFTLQATTGPTQATISAQVCP